MNRKIPYHNKEKNDVHIGPVTVPAGETRTVDSVYVLARTTRAARKETKAPEPKWDLKAFVKQKQDDEIKQLPSLTDEQLDQVLAYYQEHKPPKKLAPALMAEQEARAAAKAADEYVDTLEKMSDQQLQEELLNVAEDEGRLALVKDLLSRRSEQEEKE